MILHEKDVSVCGVPYKMAIVDGGVLFSNKSGFYGVSGRFMFEYRGHLWYLMHTESTFGNVAMCHLRSMHDLIEQHIGGDHMEADGSTFELKFKEPSGK